MPAVRIAHPTHALSMALKHRPSITHGVTEDFDHLSNIGADPGLEPWPEVYYSVRTDRKYTHIFYGLYHLRDSSHEHDFEGVQYSISRKNAPDVLMCRTHFNITAHASHWLLYLRLLYIEAGSHAVVFNRGQGHHQTHIQYGARYILKNMHTGRDRISNLVRAMGPTVTHPEEWADQKVDKKRRWLRKNYGITTTKGLFWNDPSLLIEIYGRLDLIEP